MDHKEVTCKHKYLFLNIRISSLLRIIYTERKFTVGINIIKDLFEFSHFLV
jgi:hypothetical protein